MTLIVTLVKENLIVQSSDNRISMRTSKGKLVRRDDDSIKQVIIEYPPQGTALVAWAGLAELPDQNRTKTSDWICEILRGETRGLADTLEQIRVCASREIGNREFLIICIAAFIDKKPNYFEITNGLPLRKEFTLYQEEVVKPKIFAGGIGGQHLRSSKKDLRLLNIIMSKQGKPRDFENLLAKVNSGISEHCDICRETISASCMTVCLNIEGEVLPANIHVEKSSSVRNIIIPHLLLGIDVSELMRSMVEMTKDGFKDGVFGRQWEIAAKKAITPRSNK